MPTEWTAPGLGARRGSACRARRVSSGSPSRGLPIAIETRMLTSCVLLLIIGLLGGFDVFFFHRHRCHLCERCESRTEAWIHVARGIVYVLQLSCVPNLAFHGRYYALFVALFVADAAIAITDILVEPASRKSLGGLPPGEYLMHIVLSLFVGAFLHGLLISTWEWRHLPTAIHVVPGAPPALRAALGLLALGCAMETALEALELAAPRALFRPRPLHVTVRLRTSLEKLWRITQDPILHPTWDHRFSRIIMLDDLIRTGTRMRYEKRLFGVTICGWGRYKLHAPMRQSTFEFGSDDARRRDHEQRPKQRSGGTQSRRVEPSRCQGPQDRHHDAVHVKKGRPVSRVAGRRGRRPLVPEELLA